MSDENLPARAPLAPENAKKRPFSRLVTNRHQMRLIGSHFCAHGTHHVKHASTESRGYCGYCGYFQESEHLRGFARFVARGYFVDFVDLSVDAALSHKQSEGQKRPSEAHSMGRTSWRAHIVLRA